MVTRKYLPHIVILHIGGDEILPDMGDGVDLGKAICRCMTEIYKTGKTLARARMVVPPKIIFSEIIPRIKYNKFKINKQEDADQIRRITNRQVEIECYNQEYPLSSIRHAYIQRGEWELYEKFHNMKDNSNLSVEGLIELLKDIDYAAERMKPY